MQTALRPDMPLFYPTKNVKANSDTLKETKLNLNATSFKPTYLGKRKITSTDTTYEPLFKITHHPRVHDDLPQIDAIK